MVLFTLMLVDHVEFIESENWEFLKKYGRIRKHHCIV